MKNRLIIRRHKHYLRIANVAYNIGKSVKIRKFNLLFLEVASLYAVFLQKVYGIYPF